MANQYTPIDHIAGTVRHTLTGTSSGKQPGRIDAPERLVGAARLSPTVTCAGSQTGRIEVWENHGGPPLPAPLENYDGATRHADGSPVELLQCAAR